MVAEVFVLWRSFPGWLSIFHLECCGLSQHFHVKQCNHGLKNCLCLTYCDGSQKAPVVQNEVVFESLWPGRSRYASLCKLAATNLISDPLFFFPTFYVMKEAFHCRDMIHFCLAEKSGLHGRRVAWSSGYNPGSLDEVWISDSFWVRRCQKQSSRTVYNLFYYFLVKPDTCTQRSGSLWFSGKHRYLKIGRKPALLKTQPYAHEEYCSRLSSNLSHWRDNGESHEGQEGKSQVGTKALHSERKDTVESSSWAFIFFLRYSIFLLKFL